MTTKHTPIRLEANEFVAIANILGPERTRYVAKAVNNHEALLEAAKSIEWAVVEFNSDGTVAYRTCPSCGGPDRPDYIGPEGHFPECQLAAAIAQAKGRTA